MPRKIFEPLYKRKEMEEDFQREMEFAFEDMYTGERSKTNFCGDFQTLIVMNLSQAFLLSYRG